MRPRGLKVSL